MNWRLARTLLIAAFAFVDAFLVSQLLPARLDPTVRRLADPVKLQMVEGELGGRGIRLAVTIPRRMDPRPFWRFAPSASSPEALARAWAGDALGETVAPPAPSDGQGSAAPVWKVREPDERAGWIRVGRDGRVRWWRAASVSPLPDGQAAGLDEEAARRVATAFLNERGWLPEAARFDSVRRARGSGWVVRFIGADLGPDEANRARNFISWMEATVVDGEVRSVEAVWPRSLGRDGPDKPILDAGEALRRVAEVVSGPDVVRSIEIGYYGPSYDAERWSVPPVWKIGLESGQVFYVNAFTGQFEGP